MTVLCVTLAGFTLWVTRSDTTPSSPTPISTDQREAEVGDAVSVAVRDIIASQPSPEIGAPMISAAVGRLSLGCAVGIRPALIDGAMTPEAFVTEVAAEANATPQGQASTVTFIDGVLGDAWDDGTPPEAGDPFMVAVVVYCQEVAS